MKYADLEGKRCEAARGLRAECPVCRALVIAKCGEHRVHHWAHASTRNCDNWWEPETEWHRAWKNEFPAEQQEIVHSAECGEKHIADVKTAHGFVVEFQHSPIAPDERKAREAFYRRMVWVVDGRRLKRSRLQFFRALELDRRPVPANRLTFRMRSPNSALLRVWAGNRVPVCIDFGHDANEHPYFDKPVLWLVHPGSTRDDVFVTPMTRAEFIRRLHTEEPWKSISWLRVRSVETLLQPIYLPLGQTRATPFSFAQYMARKHRARSRIRF